MECAEVEIHTDGACSGNPGPGGWGAILRYKDAEKELFGWCSLTTNNRMEILAAVRALEALKRPCSVTIYTDSQYLKNGMTRWLEGWLRRGWRTSKGKAVKNKDLWNRLLEAAGRHCLVQWRWLKGHRGHTLNERADRLARLAIKQGLKEEISEDQEGRIPA